MPEPSQDSILGEFDPRKFREKGGGPDRRKIRLIALGLVGLLGAGLLVTRLVGAGGVSPGEASRIRVMMDAETGEVFERYRIEEGQSGPWAHPSTGRRSLYPPEVCYWTRDGQAKLEPTYVLLSEVTGEPGPTICPDCGCEVVGHNPLPPDSLMLEAAERRGGT